MYKANYKTLIPIQDHFKAFFLRDGGGGGGHKNFLKLSLYLLPDLNINTQITRNVKLSRLESLIQGLQLCQCAFKLYPNLQQLGIVQSLLLVSSDCHLPQYLWLQYKAMTCNFIWKQYP